ncbi:hypothetical protein ACTFIW_002898 [Dictyostelium discoideum]
MDKNFNFTEKNLKDLQQTFQDPNILSTLLEYYDVVEKLNESEQNSTKTTKVITTPTDTNKTTNNETQPQPTPPTPPPQPQPKEKEKEKEKVKESVNNNKIKTKKVKSISGFCFKTHSDKNDRVYVMCSHYPTIGMASMTEDKGWIIPYSLFDIEKQQHTFTSAFYKVYHIIFGTDTYNESTKQVSLNRLLIQTSMQAIYQKYKESLNIAAIKISKKQFPKEFHVTIVDEPIENSNIKYQEPPPNEQLLEDGSGYYRPVFTIQNIGIDNKILENPIIIPKFIEFNINLKRLDNINELILEIEDNEKLIVREDNVKYNLEVLLKHHVEDEPIAKFNKVKKNLNLKLKVIDDDNHSHHHHDHNQNNNQNENNKDSSSSSSSIIKELDKLGFGSSSITEPRNDLPSLTFIPQTIKYHTNSSSIPQYIIKQNNDSINFIIYENQNNIKKDSILLKNNSITYIINNNENDEEIKKITIPITNEISYENYGILISENSFIVELKKNHSGVWCKFI